VKGGELHRIMAKLEEGLSWIGRGCGGLPTVDREVAGEELERRRRSEARGEMRVQERANWREGKLLNVLDQQRMVGEARTGASHDGGEVAAGQSSGRGRGTWSAWEKARGEGLGWRPAWGRRVGAARAGGGASRAAAAAATCGGRGAARAGGRVACHAQGRPAGER
jgi:hypothetical protein